MKTPIWQYIVYTVLLILLVVIVLLTDSRFTFKAENIINVVTLTEEPIFDFAGNGE